MSNPRNAAVFIRHPGGVARWACVRVFRGSGAPVCRLARPALLLASLLAVGAVVSASASAAVTHKYEETLSTKLSKGVPPGCGVTPPEAEPPCISGASSTPFAITFDGGNVWVADETRIDRFNHETGAFVPPQLDREEGLEYLGYLALGVGHAFGSEQVYATAVKAGTPQVAVFDGGSGKLQGVWTGQHTEDGSLGGGSELAGMAVDDSANLLDEAKGDVYVATNGEPKGNVVDVFDPEEAGVKQAGEEPEKVVTELRGTCPSDGETVGGTGCETVVPFHDPAGVAVSPATGDLVVADGNSAACGKGPTECVIDVFEPASGLSGVYNFLFSIQGTPTGPAGAVLPFGALGKMAMDGGTGEIYMYEPQARVVDQFSATGEYLSRIKGTPSGPFPEFETAAVGVDGETHDVFVSDDYAASSLAVFGPNVEIPDVAVLEPPESLSSTGATLHGTVNPDGNGEASCEFEYGLTTAYSQRVDCEKKVPDVNEKVEVRSTRVSRLEPDTTYHYREDANLQNGPTNFGEGAEDEGMFKTPGPGKHGESASEVASTAASLDATIDPDGSPTSYYFQYSTSSTEGCEATASFSSCSSAPALPGEAIGSTVGDQSFSQRVQGLAPETVYHYRVVLVSEPKPGETEVFPEADQTFTTQPAGGASGAGGLPDHREWELVTPADKHGSYPMGIGIEGPVQASSSGTAFTDMMTLPTEEGVPGFFFTERLLSTRGPGGWSSRDISLPHHEPVEAPVGTGQEYRFFSEDLSLGLAEPFGEFTSLKPNVFPPDTERTPYLRHDLSCQSEPATCYEPLVTGAPGYADVPEGTIFGGNNVEEDKRLKGAVEIAGASPDLSHVVINGLEQVALTSTGGDLYEWSAGKPPAEEIESVGVLPADEGGGTVYAELGENTGSSEGGLISERRAVSADGSRVVWSEQDAGLYLRNNAPEPQSATSGGVCTEPSKACTLRLDAVQSGAGEGPVAPRFQIADRDGSRVLFVDSQQLLAGAGAGDLYECEVTTGASGPGCALHDVAPGAAVLGGVLGASEDGNYVYFVSNSVVGDAAAHGASAGDCPQTATTRGVASQSCNLYMAHYDSGTRAWEAPVFIATLSGRDYPDWQPSVRQQTARVSPDGGWLAFMSDRPLTGYDNRDARSGEADEEVFLFDAAGKRVVCASCNPTGSRPAGAEVGTEGSLTQSLNVWVPSAWLAASLPDWSGIDGEVGLYQSRYLSDEGRLFFNSSDALVPQDVNNNEDVYQWEPAGVGSCSASAPGFDAATGGCVGLISSGTSPKEAAFLDASETGDDVFFMTAEKLVPEDADTSYDVYDAHVCTAEVPCVSASAPSPACTTADACRAASAPQPGIFGAPASATFSGPGNLAAVSPAAKVETRAQKLTKALRTCRKDRSRKKRKSCETAAKKRYGAPKKAKKSSHNRRTK